MNKFLKAATNVAYTENGALSFATTGSAFIDQFGKAGSYRGRSMDEVFADQEALWCENKEFAIKFPFYLRMVTRKTKFADGYVTDTPQRGQGARDEAFKRLLWFVQNRPEVFYANLWLLPIVGSWKDLWVLMSMSTDIDQRRGFKVIAEGMQSESQRDLVKKYMPQIRANKKCKTEWAQATNNLAKAFCNWAGWSAQEYRAFKSTGKAHEFQKFISQKRYDLLDWNKISGKALLNLATGKFLTNQHLEEGYLSWISQTPTAKFNGYPYELGMKLKEIGLSYPRYGRKESVKEKISKMTINAQFENLLKTAKEGTGAITGNVWCALDTSGSMEGRISQDSTVTAFDVCVSLGIYFSSLNEGAFNKNVIMFDDYSKVKQLTGTFSDMYQQITGASTAWGSTNFQSVIDEIVRIRRRNPNISLEDYPTTLLVVSDMQFNPVGRNAETNYEAVVKKLSTAFPSEWVKNFKLIWWQVNGRRTTDMPATLDDGGCYFISGFDGSIITMLLGGESQVIDQQTGEKRTPTMEELAQAAMNQEVLQLLKF